MFFGQKKAPLVGEGPSHARCVELSRFASGNHSEVLVREEVSIISADKGNLGDLLRVQCYRSRVAPRPRGASADRHQCEHSLVSMRIRRSRSRSRDWTAIDLA